MEKLLADIMTIIVEVDVSMYDSGILRLNLEFPRWNKCEDVDANGGLV